MTSEPLVSPAALQRPADPAGVRAAVRDVPAYPFTPVSAPIKLDQNESADDFPADLKALALERMLAQPWNRYPDLHADTLRERIAGHYQALYGLSLDTARIAVTVGASGAFPLAFLAAFDPGDRVAMAAPFYPPYANILTALGMRPVMLPADA